MLFNELPLANLQAPAAMTNHACKQLLKAAEHSHSHEHDQPCLAFLAERPADSRDNMSPRLPAADSCWIPLLRSRRGGADDSQQAQQAEEPL